MKKVMTMLLALALAGLMGISALAEEAVQLPNMNAFTAKTLEGEAVTQEILADANLTVVNVWSIMCGPCIEEMPQVAAFAKMLPKNVRVMTICPDADLAPDEVMNFLKEAGFEGITLVSGDGDFETLLNQVQYTPTTFFLDSRGNTVGEVIIGGVDHLQDAWLAAVNTALTEIGKPVIQLEGNQ